jgi:hypothetical protein
MKLVAFERRQAQAIMESFAPSSAQEGLVPRDGEVDYLGSLEKMANAMSDRARMGVRLALWIVTFAPLWMGVALGTMAGIPVEKRTRLLDRMLASKLFLVRELALAMKIGASFALFSAQSIRARSNYMRRPAHLPPVEARIVKQARVLPVVSSSDRPSHAGVV